MTPSDAAQGLNVRPLGVGITGPVAVMLIHSRTLFLSEGGAAAACEV